MALHRRRILGDTFVMKTSTPNQPGHRLMWKIYVIGWLVYAAFLAAADQLDKVMAGQFDLAKGALSFFSLAPSALLLALAWPLTGYLERRRAPLSTVLAVHAVAAPARPANRRSCGSRG